MKRLQFCLVVFAVLALTFNALAQVQNGQFAGNVTDPTGAAIANAKIAVTNMELTSAERWCRMRTVATPQHSFRSVLTS